mgnify:CR=1 FL=1
MKFSTLDMLEPRRHCAVDLYVSSVEFPIGTLGLTELAFWYAKETFLQDAWLYVKPQHRKGGVGVALFLAQQGYTDVANIAGGIDAWSREKDPAVPRY